MKNIILIILGIVIGAAGFYLISPGPDQAVISHTDDEQLYTCGMHPEVLEHEPGNCPICEMKLTPVKSDTGSKNSLQSKILYWQAPMDPTEIYDEPGQSKMGMDLVPVYEDQAGGSGAIKIDGRVQQNMNMRFAEVSQKTINRSIRAFGKVTVAEDFEYTVTTKINGWIEKLYFNTTGQYVKKGQPLLEIYSPELVATQEEFLLAHNNLQKMENVYSESFTNAYSLYNSTKRRLELWDISDQEIDRLKQSGLVKRNTVLRSPVNGYLIHKAVVEGDKVGGNNMPHLFLIADLSKVWVEATVYESELALLKKGQKANLQLDFMQNQAFEGTVDFIYPYLDPKTRSAHIRLKFDNPDLMLKPDMNVTVNIVAEVASHTMAIPVEAIIRTGIRNLVFVKQDGGLYEPREIKLGPESDDGFVQVKGGLLLGESIVTSGQFLLDSESQTREAIAKIRAAKENKQRDTSKMKMEQPDDSKKTNLELHEHNAELELDQKKMYTCPMHPEFMTSDPDARCPFCGMKLNAMAKMENTDKLYTCTMHPEYVTTESQDRCPICEMRLVEKSQND